MNTSANWKVLPGLSLFLLEQSIYMPQRELPMFTGEVAMLYGSALRYTLREICMKHASVFLLLGATVACAGIPQGASMWTFAYCNDSAFSKRVGGCNPHNATLAILRDGNKVCGVLNEDISNKSPSAWFAGTVHHQRSVVQFVDSFQEDVTTQGKATLVSSSNAIRWNVLLSRHQ